MKAVSSYFGHPLRLAAWSAVGIAAMSAALAGALALSGSAGSREIGDPGGFVRWGLPASTAVHHLSMSLVLASAIYLVFILPSLPASNCRREISAIYVRTILTGSTAAAVWLFSAVMVLVLGYADILGQPLSIGSGFFQQFGSYVTGTGSGRARSVVVLLAVGVATLLLSRPGRRGIVLAGTLSAAAVAPLSMVGHSASADAPWVAALSLGLHIVGVSAWLGGVILLGLLSDLLRVDRKSSAETTINIFGRFSNLAGVAFALVFGSGVIIALTRLGDVSALGSPYGILIVLKTVAILGLGVIGYCHRRWISAAITTGSTPSAPEWRLIGLESLIMAATLVLAAVLAQTTPPAQDSPGMMMGATLVLIGMN